MPSPKTQEIKRKDFKKGFGGFIFFNFTWPHSEFKKHHFPFSCKGKCPMLSNLLLFLLCFSGHGTCA